MTARFVFAVPVGTILITALAGAAWCGEDETENIAKPANSAQSVQGIEPMVCRLIRNALVIDVWEEGTAVEHEVPVSKGCVAISLRGEEAPRGSVPFYAALEDNGGKALMVFYPKRYVWNSLSVERAMLKGSKQDLATLAVQIFANRDMGDENSLPQQIGLFRKLYRCPRAGAKPIPESRKAFEATIQRSVRDWLTISVKQKESADEQRIRMSAGHATVTLGEKGDQALRFRYFAGFDQADRGASLAVYNGDGLFHEVVVLEGEEHPSVIRAVKKFYLRLLEREIGRASLLGGM